MTKQEEKQKLTLAYWLAMVKKNGVERTLRVLLAIVDNYREAYEEQAKSKKGGLNVLR